MSGLEELVRIDESYGKKPEIVPNANDVVSSTTSNVASTKKHPPPESSESIRTRGFVILSFWAIVILLGLPTWWWTTSIYRARLPLQEMLEWADEKVSGHS